MAEGVGFEPTRPCGLPVFKTSALDHSATPPVRRTVAEASLLGKPTMFKTRGFTALRETSTESTPCDS